MAYYQFKLTPVNTFFFGSEKHDNDEKANYFVESNCYPQQTTILGLIRYYMLYKHELIGSGNINKEGGKFIGNESFKYDESFKDDEATPSFGKILSVSPLYFIKDTEDKDSKVKATEVFMPAPLDLEYQMKQENDNYSLIKDNKVYTAKIGALNLKLCNADGEKMTDLFSAKAKDNPVMFPVCQTGNEKSDEGASKDDKFYKQTSMKMNDNWSFGVQVELAEDMVEETLFLPFGGEKSIFKIEIQKVTKPWESFQALKHYHRDLPMIFLLSDSFAKSEIMSLTTFAVNHVVSFRNLRSSVNTENYSAFGKNTNGLKRSSRYNLLSRGSVLYFNNSDDRSNAIKLLENKHCQTIGFNAFKLIN